MLSKGNFLLHVYLSHADFKNIFSLFSHWPFFKKWTLLEHYFCKKNEVEKERCLKICSLWKCAPQHWHVPSFTGFKKTLLHTLCLVNQARMTDRYLKLLCTFSTTPRWILLFDIDVGSDCILIKVRGKFPIYFNSATQGLNKIDRTTLYFLLNMKRENLSTKVFDQKETKHILQVF